MSSSELIERNAMGILNYSERVRRVVWAGPCLNSWKSFGLVARAPTGFSSTELGTAKRPDAIASSILLNLTIRPCSDRILNFGKLFTFIRRPRTANGTESHPTKHDQSADQREGSHAFTVE